MAQRLASAAAPAPPTTEILNAIPEGLRDPLFDAFREIMRNFHESRWEPAELNGGKLCEVTYSILNGYVDNAYPTRPTKPPNMVDACRALEQASATRFPRSIRIQIPRVVVALYELRNNRNVGHTGGDVNPNHMDAALIVQMAKWIVAELVRIFHEVDTETATQVVEGLIERTTPLIWTIGGVRRVLDTKLSMTDKMLVTLYAVAGSWMPEDDLFRSVEYSTAAAFRNNILSAAHDERMIEYDSSNCRAQISPKGIRHVETNIRLTA